MRKKAILLSILLTIFTAPIAAFAVQTGGAGTSNADQLPTATEAERDALPTADGRIIFNTDSKTIDVFSGSTWGSVADLQKTVVVDSEDDFPAINGANQHPLVTGTTYWIDGPVTVANNFLVPNSGDVVITGNGINGVLDYTGGGTMFVQSAHTGGSIGLWDVNVDGNSTATLWDITDTAGTLEVIWTRANIKNFASLGTLDVGSIAGEFTTHSDYAAPLDATVKSDFFMHGSVFFSAGSSDAIILRMGDESVAQVIDNTPFMGATESFIEVPSTANDFRMNVSGNLIAPTGGQLFESTGLDHTDPRIAAAENTGFPESDAFASIFMIINTTETAIATIGVPVLAAGTWEANGSERFTSTAAGRATYTGLEDVRKSITINFRGQNAAGNNKDFSFYINHGNDIDNVITAFADSAADPGNDTTVTAVGHSLEVGDRVPITNTTNYNLVYTVETVVDADNFDIDTSFVADDATGNWAHIHENTISSNNYSTNDAKNVTVLEAVEFTTNTYVELFTQNNTDTTNFIMTENKFHVN